MSIFITTYINHSDGKDGIFIRANDSHTGAWDAAMEDCNTDLKEIGNAEYEVDCIECEGDVPSTIRIVDPTIDYEYLAYIIEEHEVGQ